MKISYNKLWHLMLDKKMNKTDLKRVTGISTASIAKLGRGENVTTDILVKICQALDCELHEIMELDEKNKKYFFDILTKNVTLSIIKLQIVLW